MSTVKKGSRFYGFDNYRVVQLNDSLLFSSWDNRLPYNYNRDGVTFLINENLPAKVIETVYGNTEVKPELCHENRELLGNAKKLYVHPSCTLSRSMVAECYGKSLNPWTADAVVIPEPNPRKIRVDDALVFVNESAKLIALVYFRDNDNKVKAVGIEEGTKLFQVANKYFQDNYTAYDKNDLYHAEFFYNGSILTIPAAHSYALDILTGQLPTDKFLYESTIQESLATEDNKITFDVLKGIADMLKSSDDNTVGAGLKALSMMDYVHFPNSIRYIFNTIVGSRIWRHNNATNSTSVRFMFKTLEPTNKRSRWPGSYDRQIYEQDFVLLKQLIEYFKKDSLGVGGVLQHIRYYPFMCVDVDGKLFPSLK